MTIADGVIVGSAFVDIIGKYGDNAADNIKSFVEEMTGK